MAGRRRGPSNRPGAHYLRDPRLAAELIDAARVARGDLVLDLGAGWGALTRPLAKRGARVVAIERDPRNAAQLRRRFDGEDVVVIEDDVLAVSFPRRPYRVVSNVPFALTTALLGRLMDDPRTELRRAALLLELGAARGLGARRPGDARTLWWSARFDLRIARRVGASSFSPPPSVEVAVVVLEPRRPALVPPRDQSAFLSLLAHALADRRVPVARALAPIFSKRQLRRLTREVGLSPDEAVGRLSVEQWSAVNAVMVHLVPRSRWPQAKPRWWRRARRPAAVPR